MIQTVQMQWSCCNFARHIPIGYIVVTIRIDKVYLRNQVNVMFADMAPFIATIIHKVTKCSCCCKRYSIAWYNTIRNLQVSHFSKCHSIIFTSGRTSDIQTARIDVKIDRIAITGCRQSLRRIRQTRNGIFVHILNGISRCRHSYRGCIRTCRIQRQHFCVCGCIDCLCYGSIVVAIGNFGIGQNRCHITVCVNDRNGCYVRLTIINLIRSGNFDRCKMVHSARIFIRSVKCIFAITLETTVTEVNHADGGGAISKSRISPCNHFSGNNLYFTASICIPFRTRCGNVACATTSRTITVCGIAIISHIILIVCPTTKPTTATTTWSAMAVPVHFNPRKVSTTGTKCKTSVATTQW